MKELTIEQKAQRYDEAKLRMSAAYNSNRCTIGFMNEIFPELQDSEDERIRKWIKKELVSKHVVDNIVNDVMADKALAWLEKQGEQKQDVNIQINPSEYINDMGGNGCYLKNATQKSADKTKLKIEKGKWYVCISQFCNCIKGRAYRATSDSRIMDDFGTEYDMHSDAYKYFRLWTIQDAKDGDVLIDKSGSRECPFIFKETKPSDIKTDMLNPLTVLGYCGIGGAGFTKGSGWGDTANCIYYPATKEQRDTLERAMADAGYTFDFEKKELKKLSQSEVTKMSDQEEIAEIPFGAKDSELQEATYYIPKGFHAEINDDKVVIKKGEKPTAWSEEDEQITLSIEQVMNCASLLNVVPEKIDKIKTWLKSLKDRIQLHKQWKPSEEQMEALESATENCAYSEYQDCLRELIDQLKKLK